MKLVRYGNPGKEKPGLIDADGKLRDLSAVVKDIGPTSSATPRWPNCASSRPTSCRWSRARRAWAARWPVYRQVHRHRPELLGPCGRVRCLPIPKEPIVFMKATSCIQGPNDPVMLPKGSVKSDWEVELGVVIGTRARYVSQKDALNHVAGYCTINDVSEREFQLERGPQWDKGKGCDTFGPIGPWLVTRDESPTRKSWRCGWT
jgi:2,4-diketo-3-deoxy-L-fuconate hydrolase